MTDQTMPPLPNTIPAKTSALAITSLVFGILGLFTCGVTALIGLILGIIAIVKIQGSGGKLKGFGLALAGMIVSALFVFMIPIFAAMLFRHWPRPSKGRRKLIVSIAKSNWRWRSGCIRAIIQTVCRLRRRGAMRLNPSLFLKRHFNILAETPAGLISHLTQSLMAWPKTRSIRKL